jgi:YegS/Rv2252/BmrU family lipid kinase
MRKIKFIINPVAGKGSGKNTIEYIHDLMIENKIEYSVSISCYKGEVEKLAKKAVLENYTDIIAVGGDGTVTEVFNGIHHKDINLGIIPVGTGNDLARVLNLDNNIKETINKIIIGRTKKIDIGKCEDLYFLNVAGLGVDSEIIEKTEKIKKLIKGPMAYLISTFIVLSKYKCQKMSIDIDGCKMERECYLVAVGNGNYYGGGMKITPKGILEDGLFEIVIIHKMPKLKFAWLFRKVFSGDHIYESVVESYKGKIVYIQAPENVKINLDGNLIGNGSCRFEIESKQQNVLY